MSLRKLSIRFLNSLVLFAGVSGIAQAQNLKPYLERKPIQPNIKYSSAAPENCKIEELPNKAGFRIVDNQGKIVRQYYDSKGKGNTYDIISFYNEGIESYRELDTNRNGKPDAFRYLGVNGCRMGQDSTESGTIENWASEYGLTAEEVSQELFNSIQTRDTKRFASLLVSDAEINAIGLPASEVAKLKARREVAVKRFQEIITKLNLPAGAKWVHFEGGVPHTVAADVFNGKSDSVRHKGPQMLIDRVSDKKIDVVPCGELILVGNSRVWKMIDGPGDLPEAVNPGSETIPEEIKAFVDQLMKIQPPKQNQGQPIIDYHLERAALLEKIVVKVAGPTQEPWLRQLIEAYQFASEQNDESAQKRLFAWRDQIVKAVPKSAIASFAEYRTLQVEYSDRNRKGKQADFVKIQTWWVDSLKKYIDEYANNEDVPDAMMRLATVLENTAEADAIKVCERLVKEYSTSTYAAKATGTINRLKSEGQLLEISGPTLAGPNIDVKNAKGKVVIVCYWASWSPTTANDAKKLAELEKKFGNKIAIVTVSLDDTPAEAKQAVQTLAMSGEHIFQPGGIEGNPLAVKYGILGPHVFLADKEGKVTNKNAQLETIADEIEKLMK